MAYPIAPDLGRTDIERRNRAFTTIEAGDPLDRAGWSSAMSAENVFAAAAKQGVDPARMANAGLRSDHPETRTFMAAFARHAEAEVVHPQPKMRVDEILAAAGEDGEGLGRLGRVRLRALERGYRRGDEASTEAITRALTDWTLSAETRGDTARADRFASLTFAASRNIAREPVREKTSRRGIEDAR